MHWSKWECVCLALDEVCRRSSGRICQSRGEIQSQMWSVVARRVTGVDGGFKSGSYDDAASSVTIWISLSGSTLNAGRVHRSPRATRHHGSFGSKEKGKEHSMDSDPQVSHKRQQGCFTRDA